MTDQYVEYIKLHLLSLEQDMQKLESEDIVPYRQLEAAWSTAAHLLTVYSDIKDNGRES